MSRPGVEVLRLQVTGSHGALEEHPVFFLPASLGRGADSDVVIPADSAWSYLSRVHLWLEGLDGGVLKVRDVSTNGTWIGPRRLQRGERVLWKAEEPVRLGTSTVLRYRLMGGLVAQASCGSGQTAVSPVPVPSLEGSAPRPGPRVRPKGGNPSPRLEEIARPEFLFEAWQRVALNRGCAGPDRVTLEDFADNVEFRLDVLSRLLAGRRYTPLPARVVLVPKPRGGQRRLVVFSVQDRVVFQAMARALEPVFEPVLSPCSYAYRKSRSVHDALRQVDGALQECPWVVDADIEDFFDSVPHARLLRMVRPFLADGRVIELLCRILAVGQSAPARGLAQGAATSPVLSNLYLTPLDRALETSPRVLVRLRHEATVRKTSLEVQASRRAGHLLAACLLGLVLSTSVQGCGPPPAERALHHLFLLVDIGSIAGEAGLPTGLNEQVVKLYRRWTEGAGPGSRAELIVFSAADSALEVEITWSAEVPEPRPPVEQRHARFVDQTATTLAESMQEIKPVKGSPLFESVWRVLRRGSGLDGTYEVVVLSDLLQTSSLVEFTQLYLNQHEDGEIVKKIVAALPKPEKLPTRLTLLYAPGDPHSGSRVTGAHEMRLKALFRQVVGEGWSLPSERLEVTDYL